MTSPLSGSDALFGFCKRVVLRHAANWPPAEETLALDFVASFPLPPFLKLEDLIQLCGKLGIEVSVTPLPRELRGYYCCFEGKTAIVICEHRGVTGSREHTLLHEIREILEQAFRDLGHPTADGEDLEQRAEEFAMGVRMAASVALCRALLERAKQVSSKWRRRALYLFIIVFALAHSFSCSFLPDFEDRFAERN